MDVYNAFLVSPHSLHITPILSL